MYIIQLLLVSIGLCGATAVGFTSATEESWQNIFLESPHFTCKDVFDENGRRVVARVTQRSVSLTWGSQTSKHAAKRALYTELFTVSLPSRVDCAVIRDTVKRMGSDVHAEIGSMSDQKEANIKLYNHFFLVPGTKFIGPRDARRVGRASKRLEKAGLSYIVKGFSEKADFNFYCGIQASFSFLIFGQYEGLPSVISPRTERMMQYCNNLLRRKKSFVSNLFKKLYGRKRGPPLGVSYNQFRDTVRLQSPNGIEISLLVDPYGGDGDTNLSLAIHVAFRITSVSGGDTRVTHNEEYTSDVQYQWTKKELEAVAKMLSDPVIPLTKHSTISADIAAFTVSTESVLAREWSHEVSFKGSEFGLEEEQFVSVHCLETSLVVLTISCGHGISTYIMEYHDVDDHLPVPKSVNATAVSLLCDKLIERNAAVSRINRWSWL